MSGGNRRGGGPARGRARGGRRGGNRTDNPNRSRGGAATMAPPRPEGPVTLGSVMSVAELAEALHVTPIDVIKELMQQGIMATINQQVDYETATGVARAFEIETEEHVPDVVQAATEEIESRRAEGQSDPEATPRPPVVTIMGHVDHGKTKLLDAIRETKVAEGEAGGITQRIGAYQIEVQGRKITFLDTPGHEAFTAMRARGAQVTDVAILVVAADDGVMPQTREAISHVKAAGVPMIVAMNKIDLPAANPDRVKQQLAEAGVMPEEYGGDVPIVEVSAKEHLGIDDLLEVVLLVSDIGELKANPLKPAVGVIIEAKIDHSRGVTATLLVQSGTLKPRDIVVAGATWGRIRAMSDDRGRKIRKAEPASPVEVLGLLDLPEAGDLFQVVADERTARALAEERSRQRRAEAFNQNRIVKLDDIYTQMQEGGTKELPVIVKADLQGSLEALLGSLAKLNEESGSVKLTTVLSGTGAINDSDVNLAAASGAVIIGFNVRPDAAAKRSADAASIDIRYYDVIYHLIEDVRAAMSGLLDPEKREVTDGYAEVREIFRLPGREVAAGLYVLDGKINRNSRVRVLRSGTVLTDTMVSSLKRFKDDVREVAAGYECGATLEGFNDIQVGDQLEFYHVEEVARTA
ncbi:MAG: translation initiation factor IF-2 [Thermomicrobiales bacterium]|nr:translation initiation factor IF-2 [Thermomicrobiales bacterium]